MRRRRPATVCCRPASPVTVVERRCGLLVFSFFFIATSQRAHSRQTGLANMREILHQGPERLTQASTLFNSRAGRGVGDWWRKTGGGQGRPRSRTARGKRKPGMHRLRHRPRRSAACVLANRLFVGRDPSTRVYAVEAGGKKGSRSPNTRSSWFPSSFTTKLRTGTSPRAETFRDG